MLVLLVALLGLAAFVSACGPTPAAPFKDADNGQPSDHGWFEGGMVWRGDFPDPHVVRLGSTYYAYSTPSAGRTLPVLTSSDLVTWRIHSRWSAAGPPGRPGYSVASDAAIPAEIRAAAASDWTKYDQNDALVRTARWAAPHQQGPFIDRDIWAPGVIQIGDHLVRLLRREGGAGSAGSHGFGRYCISVATSTSPLGPFRDYSTSPVQCQPVTRTRPARSTHTRIGTPTGSSTCSGRHRARSGRTNPRCSPPNWAPTASCAGCAGREAAGDRPEPTAGREARSRIQR